MCEVRYTLICFTYSSPFNLFVSVNAPSLFILLLTTWSRNVTATLITIRTTVFSKTKTKWSNEHNFLLLSFLLYLLCVISINIYISCSCFY
ncbi:uncharacterized protein TEOVI_000600900 [Trypanosoma equiperdum]|uniref:Uncharacterized protein n=1 Tax=Trypanosoma equiperdum TaxID=5694 RepID=A0A1G4I7S3_TRYEQ|nr:hypothetical protein, conserved [Trypanosoma equiperdum]